MDYILKTKEQIAGIKSAGKILHNLFEALNDFLKPGMKTIEIEKYCEDFIRKHNGIPEFMNVPGYRHATCISINDEVVHGIPSAKRTIHEGDLVKIDAGVNLNGLIGDSCVTFGIGKLTKKAQTLMETTKKCLDLAIEQAVIGNYLGDIGNAIQKYAEGNDFSVVRDFVGHGVGIKLHEAPQILHYGKPKTGLPLIEGMVLAIEPMINEGTWQIKVKKDGWTAVTLDGKLSAQFEHTVAITQNGPEVLT